METIWFDELDRKYKCKDCYMFSEDCKDVDGESCICGDFMTVKEHESGVKLIKRCH